VTALAKRPQWEAVALTALLCFSCHPKEEPKQKIPPCVNLLLQATPNLNTHDGQAHVVVVYMYPVESGFGFQQSTVDDLVSGRNPEGIVGSRIELTLTPGQRLPFEKIFSDQVSQFGIVADYYHAPSEPEGARKVLVPADCKPDAPPRMLLLGAKEMMLQ